MIKKQIKSNLPELLAPAGSLEKMKIALEFGADAVYFGLPDFSLRARINKFGKKEIREGAEFCGKLGKKFYVTINIYAHNEHIKKLPEHLKFINEIKPNAIILSDPGILRVIKKECPKIPIHLSTQANATNTEAVKFWAEQGVERIILARELSLQEIKQIKKEVPKMELEVFVHGAMCMSYSGRCILSKWMTDRSANLGDCAQPCRWEYKKMQSAKCKMQSENTNTNSPVSPLMLRGEEDRETVIDDRRRFMIDLEEDRHGTYFFNSYDICLIRQLDKLMKAGVDSFKIEGRGKSIYYVAVVTKAYRQAIDAFCRKHPWVFPTVVKEQKKELEKLSHRGYWTGFVLGDEPPHLTKKAYKKTDWEFVGSAYRGSMRIPCGLMRKKCKEGSGVRKIMVHNALKKGDEVEVIMPKGNVSAKIKDIKNSENEMVDSAHGGQGEIFEVEFSKEVRGVFLIRKKNKKN